jgi:hypothetical protein
MSKVMDGSKDEEEIWKNVSIEYENVSGAVNARQKLGILKTPNVRPTVRMVNEVR